VKKSSLSCIISDGSERHALQDADRRDVWNFSEATLGVKVQKVVFHVDVFGEWIFTLRKPEGVEDLSERDGLVVGLSSSWTDGDLDGAICALGQADVLLELNGEPRVELLVEPDLFQVQRLLQSRINETQHLHQNVFGVFLVQSFKSETKK